MATVRCWFRVGRVNGAWSEKNGFRWWRSAAIESRLVDHFSFESNWAEFNIWIRRFSVELAMIMDRLYGGVCYAGIDTDPELKYPKVNRHDFVNCTFSNFLLTINRELAALHFRINKVTSQQFQHVSFNCNTVTSINVLKWNHTFWTIKCATNVKDRVVVVNLRHFSAPMLPVYRLV